MKRFMILAMVTVVMSSCALQRATTSCRSFASQTLSEIPVVADLEVGENIVYLSPGDQHEKEIEQAGTDRQCSC